jgi:hypothetical protein
LNAEYAQSQKPHARTVPRAGLVSGRSVTRAG